MSAKWGWVAIPGAVLLLLLTGQFSREVTAGGTSSCGITFADRAGDKITSDHQGAYTDEGHGISCEVGGGNNIVLSLAKSSRRFWGDYSGLVAGSAFVPNPPTGTFNDGFLVNIHDVANMTVGATKQTQAHFGRPNNIFMHWCGVSPDEPACTYSWGSMAVAVMRTAKRTWLVTTDPPAGDESFVGDTTVLADNTGAAPIALYHMPFQLTVDCPKCH